MKVPNESCKINQEGLSLSRLQNEGSQPEAAVTIGGNKSIKATE